MSRTPAGLLKILAAKLAGSRNHGRAHGPVFVRTLSPRQVGRRIDPQGESHSRYDELTGMPTEKELLQRIRDLEAQNSALQDKLDMIWAILAPDFEEADEDDEEGLDSFVQIKGLPPGKKPD